MRVLSPFALFLISKVTMTKCIIRPATLADIQTIIEWAAAEGWNPGLNDAACFHAADPSGFFVGELDGRLVSAISAVKYRTSFAFIGLYIVHPDFRGRGIGMATWAHALKSVEGRNLGLDGVMEQAGNYGSAGFSVAYPTIRYRTLAGSKGRFSAGREPLPNQQRLNQFDRHYFPAERSAFLQAWVTQPGAIVATHQNAGNIEAFSVMRPCREGWKIGPWFAGNAAAAERVLVQLLDQAQGQAVFIDVPQCNREAVALVDRAAMVPVFETVRMYTQGIPEGCAMNGVYGVTSLELG